MARTKKGSKAPGYDYWGKRGWCDKNTTKRSERAETRTKIKKAIKKESKDE